MKIVKKNNTHNVRIFGDLKPGDVFQFADDKHSTLVCMALYPSDFKCNDDKPNYVYLNNGALKFTNTTEQVILLNATVIINPNN